MNISALQHAKFCSVNNNYTYIVASIPVLSPSYKPDGGSVMPVVDWIKSQLSEKDRASVDFVCDGFDSAKLDESFYRKAFSSRDGFTKEFFAADLQLRNAKVKYLNTALERPANQDVMEIEDAPEVASAARIDKIFTGDNLLEREKAIDNFLWETADQITLMMNFKLANILAITAKLCIIERWLALDEKAGRELLSQLVTGIRGTYGNINFEQFR